jgi:hypothetical protein
VGSRVRVYGRAYVVRWGGLVEVFDMGRRSRVGSRHGIGRVCRELVRGGGSRPRALVEQSFNATQYVRREMQLRIAVIEDDGITNETVHCLTSRLRNEPLSEVTRHFTFTSIATFRTAFVQAVEYLAGFDNARRLLVVSAHGIPETGTHLAITNSEEELRFFEHLDLLKIPIEGLTVYISACWGGYAANVHAFQASSIWPLTVIGPVVSISDTHNIEVQNAIINSLRDDADPDCVLDSWVTQFNSTQETHYHKKAIRIAPRNGEPNPEFGAEGLAVDPFPWKKYLVIGQHDRSTAQFHLIPDLILWSGTAFWRLPSHYITSSVATLPQMAGKVIELKGRIQESPRPAKTNPIVAIGRLTDISKWRWINNTPPHLRNRPDAPNFDAVA